MIKTITMVIGAAAIAFGMSIAWSGFDLVILSEPNIKVCMKGISRSIEDFAADFRDDVEPSAKDVEETD